MENNEVNLNDLENMNELEEVAGFISDFLQDAMTWVRLEWYKPHSEDTIVLAQFFAAFDLCDVTINEAEQELALEFLFHPNGESEEIPSLSIPVDPDDVEVNILDRGLEIDSLDFSLSISITSHSPTV